MPDRLRTALVLFAIALHGCGEGFTTTGSSGGAAGSDADGGGAGTTASTTGEGATTSSGGAGGGTGGVTCADVDEDGDGFSRCDADCDDANPFAHPGALEICGDAIDEDCDGEDGAGDACDDHNVYVSQLHGKVGAKGTQADPVATLVEAVTRAQALGGPAAILVSAGAYAEGVTLSGALSLIGGYDPDDWSSRDPVLYPTVIKDVTADGLKLVGLAPGSLVDGLAIEGRSVADPGDSSVAVTIDGGSPLLAGCMIAAGAVAAGEGASIAVRAVADAAPAGAPALVSVAITAGPASGGPTYGVLVDGPGIALALARSTVTAGKGTLSIALASLEAAAITASRNTLQSGTATGTFAEDSASFGAVIAAGALTFDANLVNLDQVTSPPKCFTPDVWCGGVRVSTAEAVLTNNVIYGGASDLSVALHLVEDGPSLDAVVVSSNRLQGAGHAGDGTVSAAVLLASPRSDAVATKVGRFRNNLLRTGGAESSYAFLEEATLGESCDPAALDHNLLQLVNPAVTSVYYGDWDGLTGADLATLGALPGAGENLTGDPKISEGHIGPDSPCLDAGTSVDAPDHDIDQDPRPQLGGFDIGPDELLAPD